MFFWIEQKTHVQDVISFFYMLQSNRKYQAKSCKSDGEVGRLMTFMSNKVPCCFSTLLVFFSKGPTSTKLLICDKGFLLVFFKCWLMKCKSSHELKLLFGAHLAIGCCDEFEVIYKYCGPL